MDVLNNLNSLWTTFSSAFSGIYSFMSQNVRNLLPFDEDSVFHYVLEFVVDTLGIGNISLMSLMLGTSITFIIIFSIVKWVIGIIK